MIALLVLIGVTGRTRFDSLTIVNTLNSFNRFTNAVDTVLTGLLVVTGVLG